MTFYEELKERGVVKDVSSPDLEEKLNNESLTFYIGTDPTADSLHVGHLSSFLISKRLKEAGHHPYLLVGGATGMIGDPRPTKERAMISKEQVLKNVDGLTKQAKEIFNRALEEHKEPKYFISKDNAQVSDKDELDSIINKIIDANSSQVEAYKNGKTNLLGFFVGQVMKETKGRANPKTVNELVRQILEA